MERNYRVTFRDGQWGKKSKDVDIRAEGYVDAFHKAYNLPESRAGVYSNVSVIEVLPGPGVIGIEFSYRDTVLQSNFTGHVYIKAGSEAEAIRYYQEYYMGKRFFYDAGKNDEGGKCIRGKILNTFYACTYRYDADATKERLVARENKTVDSVLETARRRSKAEQMIAAPEKRPNRGVHEAWLRGLGY